MSNPILFSLVAIGILGIACQWLAWIVRLPAILLLLIVGIIAGPVTGMLIPDRLFGELLFPIVSLSVAVILFEGSLTLKLDEIRGHGSVVRNLTSIGAIITWVVISFATYHLLGFPFELALLFGAVVVVTGPTVIIPMLRTVRPNAKIANILRWEGIVIDPVGALLAVLVFYFIISGKHENAFGMITLLFGKIVITGIFTGTIAAWALGLILRRHLAPTFLHNVISLAMVVGVYALSEYAEHESGLLAVTTMGIILANMRNTDIEEILDFKESLSVLLISCLFIILAARIEFWQLINIGWPSLAILAVIMFVARPLAVFVSAIGSSLTLQEITLISWIGPRGIVAAAISALFAIRLESAGYPEAVYLVPLTFMMIIGTVVIQSLTAKLLAKWLDVREPPPHGVLIIGAGNVARAIGKTLQDHDYRVVLTDSNWENTRLARMDGLETYYGNPISEHAERHLDLTGLGRVLAMSGRSGLDTLSSLRFKPEFGSNNIYELKTTRDKHISSKHTVSTRHRGYQLFGEDITYGTMANWLQNGAEIKGTQLSDEFNFEKYKSIYGEKCIPLFAIDPKNKLHVFVANGSLWPEAGWTIISLILKEEDVV